MRRIMIDRYKCEACLGCVLGCMVEHNKKGKSIYDLDLEDMANESRNHVEVDYENRPAPIICRHCEDPECVTTCMSGAMTKMRKQDWWNTIRTNVPPALCVSCPAPMVS